ncbi:MAG: hypothetical protein ACXVNM_01835 [Bacteroidia bacterium]
METIKVYTQHEENKKWMNTLLFYRDEIKVMESRLGEVASKNNAKDVLALVEQFQNQLTVQKENIDILKHEINLSDDAISAEIKKNKTAIDHREIKKDIALTQKLEAFDKSFHNNKASLNLFLMKWM